MKNIFGRKKDKLKKFVPRELDAIKQEYAELRAKAGDAQYQRHVYDVELENLNRRLREVNNEAGLRMQLDKAEAAKQQSLAPQETSQQ